MIDKNDLVTIKPGADLCGSGLEYGDTYAVVEVPDPETWGRAVGLWDYQKGRVRWLPADSLRVIGRVEHARGEDSNSSSKIDDTVGKVQELYSIAGSLAERCDNLTRDIRKLDSELDTLYMLLHDLESALS